MTFYNITPGMTPEKQEQVAIDAAREFIVCDYGLPKSERKIAFATIAEARKRAALSDRALIYAIGGDIHFPWSIHISAKA